MSLQIDSLLVIWGDRKDMDFVAILDLERRQLRCIPVFRGEVEAQHATLFMGFETLHLDVLKCRGGQNATCETQDVRERFLIAELVNCWAPHHARHGYLRSNGRHHQSVAVLELLGFWSDTTKKQIVRVHLFEQLAAAIMLKKAQRAAWCHSIGSNYRIEGR